MKAAPAQHRDPAAVSFPCLRSSRHPLSFFHLDFFNPSCIWSHQHLISHLECHPLLPRIGEPSEAPRSARRARHPSACALGKKKQNCGVMSRRRFDSSGPAFCRAVSAQLASTRTPALSDSARVKVTEGGKKVLRRRRAGREGGREAGGSLD